MIRVMTVDLEDWFHSISPDPNSWDQFERRAEAAVNKLLNLFDRYRINATFFVLGDVAKHNPDLVRQISEAGHEIGSHGMNHRLLYDMTKEEFRSDLSQSINLLQDITGKCVRCYRAPYFSITRNSLWALDILAQQGIEVDSSVFPVFNHRYGIHNAPRIPWRTELGLQVWPVSTIPTPLFNIPFAGGVYFRCLPARFVVKAAEMLADRGEPLIFYIHPWELDAFQPRYCSRSRFSNFRHYYGLHRTEIKLVKIMAMGGFIKLSEARMRNDSLNTFNVRELVR